MFTAAQWIAPDFDPVSEVISFRKNEEISGNIKQAKVKITALGIYSLRINGHRVAPTVVLEPGCTSSKRVQVQEYDVTDILRKGTNNIVAGVGAGWYNGEFAWEGRRHVFADRVALRCEICAETDCGTAVTFGTDESWEVWNDKVVSSELYHGETVDMTRADVKLGNAIQWHTDILCEQQQGELITEQELLRPVEIIRTPSGETVVDFGQNFTGYARLTVRGKRGGKIVLHHAEVLDKDGNFYIENLREARCENVYILSGGKDIFQPTYSFQGFRYLRLTEWPFDTVDLGCFCGVVVHSKLKRTGDFVCGLPELNQLYHNTVWGQKGNYLDIPTDCPQRNERLGWTGDAQVFCRTAAINFDVEKFFEKWLRDMALDQDENGCMPSVVPDALAGTGNWRGACGWGDSACIIPWQMYLAYGNIDDLNRHFPMMKKWVDFVRSRGKREETWEDDQHFGDWLAMDCGDGICEGATPKDLLATAFFYYSAGILVKAGKLLGEDVSVYENLLPRIKQSFREIFIPDGKLCPRKSRCDIDMAKETQTCYVIILKFGLYEGEEERKRFTNRLVEMINDFGERMSTGFLGTPYILHVLSENGHPELAYNLLLQHKNPSWLFSVDHGATTVWEHWDSLKDDGTFWSPSMNSFNHYAYGSVFDWVFGTSLGIQPMEEHPAYREFILSPHPDRRLGFAKYSFESRQGKIVSYWYYKGDRIYYEFTVPSGCTAHLMLPDKTTDILHGGTYHFVTKA